MGKQEYLKKQIIYLLMVLNAYWKKNIMSLEDPFINKLKLK